MHVLITSTRGSIPGATPQHFDDFIWSWNSKVQVVIIKAAPGTNKEKDYMATREYVHALDPGLLAQP